MVSRSTKHLLLYYIPIYNALESFISNVVIINPKWITVIKSENNDNKDAKWIAYLFKIGIVHHLSFLLKILEFLENLLVIFTK